MEPIATGLVAVGDVLAPESSSTDGRPARWAATGRSGGASVAPYESLNLADYVGDDHDAVRANRARLAAALGLRADRLVVMDAVHGADVATVEAPGVAPTADALVTRTPGLAIVALGADCVPIALIGDDGRTVAVAHCGWRGLVADVVGAVVARMEGLGSGVQRVVLGPAVCGFCYPVPVERADEVRAACPGDVAAAALVTCADGQPGIDVRSGVMARLGTLGVAAGNVEWAGGCTVEDPSLFSFRRDGVTGRQGIAAVRAG